MLRLRKSQEASPSIAPEYLPVDERTAQGLERALLALDQTARHRELLSILSADPAFAEWAAQAAAFRRGRAIESRDELVDWLSAYLEIELASALSTLEERAANVGGESSAVEQRLPALAAKLADCARRMADFGARLEHEKLESLKELAYGAGHEINNPLANIAARAQTLLRDETQPERQRKLAAIHRQAMRAHEMISDLMLFARPPKLKLAPCDLRQLAQQVVDDLGELAGERDIRLTCEFGNDDLVLPADESQLAVALDALVTNSLEAVGPGGNIIVAVGTIQVLDQPWAEIVVHDDGPGISPEVRRHMFDPFFSGREAGRGLGFGLSKCWRIVTDHGGQVVVRETSGRGAALAILLPSATPAASSP